MHRRSSSSIDLAGPYEARPVRWLHHLELDGWTVKVYGISASSAEPDRELVEEGEAIAGRVLTALTPSAGRPEDAQLALDDGYGVATLIVHQARDGNFVLVSWWTGENMLRQRTYHAPPQAPLEFEDIGHTGIVACVWELAVLDFEGNAWVECILSAPKPDIEAYLARTLSADI